MTGFVNGSLKATLRLEGLVILIIASLFYWKMGFSWATFFIFFLVPDLSFAGYLFGAKIGAIAYNCAHSLIGALAVLGFGFYQSAPLMQTIGLIWLAHIGFDRCLGYGLKYAKGFGYTHLGIVGKAANISSQTGAHK